MSFSRLLLCGAFFAGISGGAAQAGYVAFNNLSNGGAGNDAVANVSNGGAGPLAQSFSTTSAGSITGLKLFLGGGGIDADSIVITLHNDLSHSPGSVLGSSLTVSDSLVPAGAGGVYTLDNLQLANLFAPLTASTRYWIEIHDLYAGNNPLLATNVTWSLAQDASGTGVSGQFTMDAGTVGSNSGAIFPAVNRAPLLMEVDVPEPMTLAVLGVGIAGLGWVRNRRQKSASKL